MATSKATTHKAGTSGTFGGFFSALMVAVEHARAEHADDNKITPAEVLDVLVSLIAAVAAMLPGPVKTLANLFVSVGRSLVGFLGETPGIDETMPGKVNSIVALMVHRETSKLIGNKGTVEFGRISTRMRTPRRTGKVPSIMKRNRSAD